MVQLKESQKLKSKVCIKSNRVEVENVSSNHHEEVQGSRDGVVSQEMLESTSSQQIDDTSTVSVALLTVVSESQVDNGVVNSAADQLTAIV